MIAQISTDEKNKGLDNFRVDFFSAELVFSQRYFPLGDEI